SSRARNRSADPVVSCFFGRIALSNAATESCFSIRGNRENEIASFQGLRHGNLAISSQQSRQKKTLAQWVRNSSRATCYLIVHIASSNRRLIQFATPGAIRYKMNLTTSPFTPTGALGQNMFVDSATSGTNPELWKRLCFDSIFPIK